MKYTESELRVWGESELIELILKLQEQQGVQEYTEEVEEVDTILNGEGENCLHNFDDDDALAICSTCGVIRSTVK